MAEWTLDQDRGMPLYQQLMQLIEEKIKAGDLVPGRALPAERKLAEELKSPALTEHIDFWLTSRLPNTLHFNRQLTGEAADRAVSEIGPVWVTYEAGKDRLAKGGKPLKAEQNYLGDRRPT